MTLLRVSTSAALRERRLAALKETRSLDDAQLEACVRDARLLGSLELAGIVTSWAAVHGRHAAAVPEAERLRRAEDAVAPDAPLGRSALQTWQGVALGVAPSWRAEPVEREGPPAAPPERIDARLEILETWFASESVARLGPSQVGALALARIVEIRPFEDGNGRVSRLAACHVVRRAGGRAPILVGADGPRLRACLQAAFALDLGPLAQLLEEAGERVLDVMIQALEGRG